ncbi:hypothetical protein CIW50_00045 [Tardiphaga sp. P9-11]|jgi:heme/copper-type cytochrome/quinol oxidase subunit 3|nr:hypothetical protein CIW50_00045 [Tardiphaga sp. P9-11]
MVWQNAALGMAGVIGAGVAVFHGILIQRLMVAPFEAVAMADRRFSGTTRRLVAPLLHFSTVVWFLGGIALVFAANVLDRDARLAISLLVGGTYLFGAVFNFWATHGRHPGWMLMAAAVALIAFGTIASGV